MIEPQVQWTAPSPFWNALAGADDPQLRAVMRRPGLLRFATDAFMDEFKGALENQPERLSEWRAHPETWRGPSDEPLPIEKLPPFVQRLHRLRLATAGPLLADGRTATSVTALHFQATSDDPLKLYQPAHQRFYLVSACLVCRIPGLPDRMLDIGSGERVTYVVRRLRPKEAGTIPQTFDLNTCDEYAFVNGNSWQKVDADRLAPGEEQTPLFGTTFIERDGRKRRLLSALVPVGKRETYVGSATVPPAEDDSPTESPPNQIDPRKALLLRDVTDPWRELIKQVEKATSNFTASKPPGLDADPIDAAVQTAAEKVAQDQGDYLSWYVLLDFGEFLKLYVRDVWDVMNGDADATTLSGSEAALHNKLTGVSYTDPAKGPRTLAQAIVDIQEYSAALETTSVPFPVPAGTDNPYPDFRFALYANALAALVVRPEGMTADDYPTLDDIVTAALPDEAPPSTPPLPLAASLANAAQSDALNLREPVWFIIRCVFERPNCGPLTPVVFSEATEPFQMASFFDPQAPARPIRIALPLDTTPAGLRKFDKNTAFMISDVLCGQMARMGNITFGDLIMSVLPWPLHKDLNVPDTGACEDDGLQIGMICSLSIPIITICALILLIIIVNLLDLIFRWIPFFITCFPLPKFNAKEA